MRKRLTKPQTVKIKTSLIKVRETGRNLFVQNQKHGMWKLQYLRNIVNIFPTGTFEKKIIRLTPLQKTNPQ
ncbi:hypothetical protein CV_1540 [Chromobacterium violaceum ATCC 12472]|uniref:Uncharacterized protein n=1 Tax=Chromobacterium violaceum (strain ATCC 12472 / DSM 30191 / JCM 1249 / CCUG 213 / NBRC 12614 / NCIMB 9131 / NCTC 9757 / MK) TaxID=243365 RepID=Q7NXT6_CHRVO|nr:hypothetical protein CV_1540 [Chromobacterium violaceum ATCC 12472]